MGSGDKVDANDSEYEAGRIKSNESLELNFSSKAEDKDQCGNQALVFIKRIGDERACRLRRAGGKPLGFSQI